MRLPPKVVYLCSCLETGSLTAGVCWQAWFLPKFYAGLNPHHPLPPLSPTWMCAIIAAGCLGAVEHMRETRRGHPPDSMIVDLILLAALGLRLLYDLSRMVRLPATSPAGLGRAAGAVILWLPRRLLRAWRKPRRVMWGTAAPETKGDHRPVAHGDARRATREEALEAARGSNIVDLETYRT